MSIMNGNQVRILLLASFTAMFSSIVYCDSQATQTEMQVAANGGLRMRTAPNIQSQKVLTIPNHSIVQILEFHGEEIELSGAKGRWVRVIYEHKEGWVFSGFLKEIGSNADLSKLVDKQAVYCEQCQDGPFLWFTLHSDGTFEMTCNEAPLAVENPTSQKFTGTWTAMPTGVILKGSYTSSSLTQPQSVAEKGNFNPITIEFKIANGERFSDLSFISNQSFYTCLKTWDVTESNNALAGWRIH